MQCEKHITLSCQAEDFDTGAARPEETLELRIFWDGPGFDIDWEALSYTRERQGKLLVSSDFGTDLGEQMYEWGAAHFAKMIDDYQAEDEDFQAYRDHHYQQHREDCLHYQRSVL